MRKGLILTAAVAGLLLLGATNASATVTMSSFTATPSTTTAAAHPNFTTTFNFSYSSASDDVKSTVVNLPAGLVGNPTAATKCTVADLAADNCAASSKIGSVTSTAKQDLLPLLPPVQSTGDVYNVAPTGSEPARIGMVIRPLGGVLGKITMSGPASVRVPGDFGLTTRFDNLPRTLPVLGGGLPVGIQIQSITLTLNGVGPLGKAFMTNPTSCGAASTSAIATSYDAPSTQSVKFSSYTPTDCAGVPFNPVAVFLPGTVRASVQEGVIAGVLQPGTEFPRSQAQIKKSTVYLPQGTSINFAKLAGITPCTDAQFNVGSAAPPTCPANSQIGLVILSSPLVGTVVGRVFFAAATPTAPLRQFVTAPVTATQTAKFVAVNQLLPGTVGTTLDNLPQTPVNLFLFVFPGLPQPTLLTAPATCGDHYGAAVFTPFAQTQTGAFFDEKVTETATGAPCPSAAAAQSQTLAASATNSALKSAQTTAPSTSSVPKRLRPLVRSLRAGTLSAG